MKKIVGAVLATSLIASSAFAADIGFSYTGSNYFKSSGGNLNFADRTDCFGVSITGENSGVVVDFDTEDATKIVQDTYYGWMNFAIPTGSLQVTAGCFTGRYVNRMKADAGDLEGADFEMYKPGVIKGAWGADSDNLTNNKIATVLAYTNKDVLPGDLLVKFGLVNGSWDPTAKAATTAKNDGDTVDSGIVVNSGFAAEVAYRQADLINVNFAFKSPVANEFSYGLFASPLMFDKVNMMFGATFASKRAWREESWSTATTKPKSWGKMNKEFGFDFRLRYAASDVLSFTTMHNISCPYVTTKYKVTEDGKEVEKSVAENATILWDMFNVNFKMADNISVGCTANFTFDLSPSSKYRSAQWKANGESYNGFDLVTSPYVVIKATEKVTVTTSFRVATSGINPAIDGHETVDVTVPVLFSFNY